MTQDNPVQKIQSWLIQNHGGAFLIPKSDPYQNEYSLDKFNILYWISNFTGSVGFSIITKNTAAIFVDGRYTLQAKEEVDKQFTCHDLTINTIVQYIKKNVYHEDNIIFFDPWLHTATQINTLQKKLVDYQFKPLTLNPIWSLWKNRPNISYEKAILYQSTNETFNQKKQKILTIIHKHNAIALIITEPDAICWLLNIRGRDIPYCPIMLAFGILYKDGSFDLFTDIKKIQHLSLQEINILPNNKFLKKISELSENVLVDPNNTAYAVVHAISKKIFCNSPIMYLKAIKNSEEISGIKKAHVRDGVALTNFLYQLPNLKSATEQSASDAIDSLRAKQESFLMPSFKTISASGAHSALPHYQTTKKSNCLLNDIIYLIDSGGHYLDGTTDITRTVAMKKPTKTIKKHFTLVLKGHIRLATIIFPKGTCGTHLDTLARQFLWDHGLDYAHGTGHGVGACLNVHEGPCNISKKLIDVPLTPGMILSNEPGYYLNNMYGIRIENLILVIHSSFSNFYTFETISFAPIDTTLIESTLLTDKEKTWLNQYHQLVFNKLSPHLESKVRIWLQNKTQPLQ